MRKFNSLRISRPKSLGFAVLEMALCLILFVTILLSSVALSCYLLNKQIVEHAVYANAGKISTVPYRISTDNGQITYTLDEGGLQDVVARTANELSTVLSTELFQVPGNNVALELGYLELSGAAGSVSVKRAFVSKKGAAAQRGDFASISGKRLAETLAGINSDNTANGPPPVVLRARVTVPTLSFTRFDILRVTPDTLECDVIIPLRQQAGLLAKNKNSLIISERVLS